MTTHRLELPYHARPPLHANQRLNRHSRDQLIAQVRRDAGWLAKSAKIGRHDHVIVWLEWRPRTRRKRDGAENLWPLMKPLVDGAITDAGVCPDDTPEHVERRMPVLLEPDRETAGLWLVVKTP